MEEFLKASWPVLNNSDMSFITRASDKIDDIKGELSTSDIFYFKGTSIDLGIIHQNDELLSKAPQKTFTIFENELGFYVETFIISFQNIEKLKIFPLKNEALDYLKNFTENRNLCVGIKEELVFQNVSNLLLTHLIIEKVSSGFVYRSRLCNLVAEDSKNKLCDECINIFIKVDEDCGEINVNHQNKVDLEDIGNGIENHIDEAQKVAYVKNENDPDLKEYYFEAQKPSRKYSCNQCDAVFNKEKTLYRHNQKCHSIKTEEKEDIENDASHRGTGRHACDMCSVVFKYKRSLHTHMRQCHSIDLPLPKRETIPYKSLQCPHCEKAFSATISFNKHLRDVHGEDVYVPGKRIMKKCPVCEEEFNVSRSSYKLVCHLRQIHHDEDLSSVIKELELGERGRVVCKICKVALRTKYILANHIKTVHETSDEPVPCHVCGKLLRQTYAAMYSHLKRHDTEDTPCKYCGKMCKNKRSARNHERSHEPNFRKIECKECRRKFSRMIHLKKHMRYVHLKIKEAKCDICEKMFSTKSKMDIHRNSVHSQEKQFACEFCHYRSARNDNLQLHRRKVHEVYYKNMIAYTPQMTDIPFYLKDTNSDRNETPPISISAVTVIGELSTYLNDTSPDNNDTQQIPAVEEDTSKTPVLIGERSTYLKDTNPDKNDTPPKLAIREDTLQMPVSKGDTPQMSKILIGGDTPIGIVRKDAQQTPAMGEDTPQTPAMRGGTRQTLAMREGTAQTPTIRGDGPSDSLEKLLRRHWPGKLPLPSVTSPIEEDFI